MAILLSKTSADTRPIPPPYIRGMCNYFLTIHQTFLSYNSSILILRMLSTVNLDNVYQPTSSVSCIYIQSSLLC